MRMRQPRIQPAESEGNKSNVRPLIHFHPRSRTWQKRGIQSTNLRCACVSWKVCFSRPRVRAVTDTPYSSPRTIAQRLLPAASLNCKPLYWTVIVVSFFASDFDFGRCMVNIPSFDSALIASASIASGSMKLREKLP